MTDDRLRALYDDPEEPDGPSDADLQKVRRILEALTRTRPGVEHEELTRAYEWVDRVEVEAALVRLILAEKLAMEWDEGDQDWHFWTAEAAARERARS